MTWSGRRAFGLIITAAVLVGCSAQPQEAAGPGGAHPAESHASPEPPAPLREGERFVELAMERPFTPAPATGSTDEYRCFLVDPKLTETSFIVGSQFLPQNPDIVHHAIFFRVQPDQVEQARKLDADENGDGWTCFGGPGIGEGPASTRQLGSGAAWIAAWAPGGKENVGSGKAGYQMVAGSQLVMQMHYSTVALGGAKPGPDQSAIRLRVAGPDRGIVPLQTTLLPGPVELPCLPHESGPLCDRERSVIDVWSRFGEQAGAAVAGLNLLCNGGRQPVSGPVQSCDHKARENSFVHAVAGHMHLLGRSIKIELNPGTPGAQILLDNQNYDFDDQGARPLGGPVAVKKGDTVRVTCTHDAALRSQLPALKTLEPRYVVWGEGTSDEMCLGILTWTKA